VALIVPAQGLSMPVAALGLWAVGVVAEQNGGGPANRPTGLFSRQGTKPTMPLILDSAVGIIFT